LIAPGHRRRGEVLVDEARSAVKIVLGTAPWLVLAGMVEGFITPRGLNLLPALGLGFALAVPYWLLIYGRGRIEDAPPTPVP
jgi:hypothetical protein